MSTKTRALSLLFFIGLSVGGCDASPNAECWEVKCTLSTTASVEKSDEAWVVNVLLRFGSEQQYSFPWFEDPFCNLDFNTASADETLLTSSVRCVQDEKALPSANIQRLNANERRQFHYAVSQKRRRKVDANNPIELRFQGYITKYEDDTFIATFSENVYFTFRDKTIVHTSIRLEPRSALESESEEVFSYLIARIKTSDEGELEFNFLPVIFDREGNPTLVDFGT
ncbi:MAG: hypothetical protein AAGL69_10390 [Pseudomonadota bacterium]